VVDEVLRALPQITSQVGCSAVSREVDSEGFDAGKNGPKDLFEM
jgi:hypothetical protein